MATPLRERNTFVYHGVLAEGQMVLTYKHARDSEVILAKGRVLVEHYADGKQYKAPALIPLAAGKHYKITALVQETIMCCVHHLEDGEMVPPVMEG